MALPVPDGVACVYNTIVFPANIRTKIVEEPVSSGDNRTVKYSRITIEINGFWTQDEADEMAGAAPGAPLDALMRAIRVKLQVNGKNLQYVNKGYGVDLNINQANGADPRDVAMGPKPGKLSWWPLGGAPDGCHGAGFSWSVSTCIPECLSATFRPGPGVFTEVFYTVSFDTGEDGLVTITTSGSASIPLSLQANNVLTANIDEYIGSIVAVPSLGFLRRINRQISADRSTCTFTITDRQVEIAYPNDVVNIEMEHTIKQTDISAKIWDATISGSVRLQPGVSKNIALQRVLPIIATRIQIARTRGQNNNVGITPPIMGLTEHLFKNELRFSVRYKILGTQLETIILNSGLWTQINIASAGPIAQLGQTLWTTQTWAASLRGPLFFNDVNGPQGAQTFGGGLGAKFGSPTNDVIIDVCNYAANAGGARQFVGRPSLAAAPDDVISGEFAKTSAAQIAALEPINLMQEIPGPSGQLSDQGESEYDPESSWINWRCTVVPVTNHNIVRHKPLAGTVKYTTPNIDPLGPVVPVAQNKADQTPGWSASVPDVIQQVSSPSMMIELRGFGVRLAYRVQPPKLISFGGQTPVLVYESTPESTLAMAGGVVTYRTDWVLRYLVPTAPDSIPLPANPYQGIDGEAA